MTDTNSSTNLGEKHLVVIYGVSGSLAVVVLAVGVYLIVHFCCQPRRCKPTVEHGRRRKRRRQDIDRRPPDAQRTASRPPKQRRPATRPKPAPSGRHHRGVSDVEHWVQDHHRAVAVPLLEMTSGPDSNLTMATIDHSIHKYWPISDVATAGGQQRPTKPSEQCRPPPTPHSPRAAAPPPPPLPPDRNLLPDVVVVETREQRKLRELQLTKRLFPEARVDEQQVYALREIFTEPQLQAIDVSRQLSKERSWPTAMRSPSASGSPGHDAEPPPAFDPPPPPGAAGRGPPDQPPQAGPSSLTGTVDIDGACASSDLQCIPQKQFARPSASDDGGAAPSRTALTADVASVGGRAQEARLSPCAPSDSPATAPKSIAAVDPDASLPATVAVGKTAAKQRRSFDRQQPNSVEMSDLKIGDDDLQLPLPATESVACAGGRGAGSHHATLSAEHASSLQANPLRLHGPGSIQNA